MEFGTAMLGLGWRGGGLNSAFTVRASFILESAAPVIFETFLLELEAFRLTPVIVLQEAQPINYWKSDFIPNRAYDTIKSVRFSWKHFGAVWKFLDSGSSNLKNTWVSDYVKN